MPALPQTSEELIRLIDRSGLLPAARIRERLAGQKPPEQALPFAKWLVKAGLLTVFQADQLLLGKSRGFYLGNYLVLQRLGGGATAGVFLCEHRVMKHRVAIKVLSQQLLDQDANTLVRFRREAQAAAALSHPNIVRTIDFAEHEGRHFLVMEYVEGVTLDQWMKQNPTAPVRAHVGFILQATLGLQHIHESGLIHRDLKPSNLLLDRQGTVKILDLGLARFTDDRHDSLSRLQGANIMGTVDFMAPEQTEGNSGLDIRTDIYGLGATLYYLLTGGETPFKAPNLGAKLIAIQFQTPKPIREFRPEVDPLLDKVVERMMAKEQGKRFQTPQEVISVLQQWLNRSGKKSSTALSSVRSRAAKPKSGATSVPRAEAVESPAPTREPVPKPDRRHRIIMWSLRAAAVLLTIGALALLKPWSTGHKAAAQGNPPAETK